MRGRHLGNSSELRHQRDAACAAVCPMGAFCIAGSALPQSCPLGTFNPAAGGRSLSDCVGCPAGASCVKGSQQPTLCPVGFFQSRAGQGSCDARLQRSNGRIGRPLFPHLRFEAGTQVCPPARYCLKAGTIEPQLTQCERGSFFHEGTATCRLCMVGHWCDGRSAYRCVPGSHSTQVGSRCSNLLRLLLVAAESSDRTRGASAWHGGVREMVR